MSSQLIKLIAFKTYSRSFSRTASHGALGHVLIGGGTGFIGNNLREVLLRENYKVTVVSRVRTGEKHIVTWNDIIQNGIPCDVTAVVNLTGEPIMIPFKYFGKTYKKRISVSRIGSTMLLAHIIDRMEHKPNVLIAITSANIYPPNKEVHTENFHPTDLQNCNFFTKLGHNWENAIKCAPNTVRQVSIRTGTVLGHNGGFNKWLHDTSNMGLIAKLGDGCQHQPWIHMSDLLYLILFAIENQQIKGTLNGVSPGNITNGEITAMYAKILKKPTKNIPKILLKGIYGKERTQLLLEGRQALPTRTLSYGFTFEYCDIEKALRHLLCCKLV